MATQIKATKKNSPAVTTGRAKNNKDADAYSKKGTGVTAEERSLSFPKDPNTMKADESLPGGMPARSVSIGNKTREPKTSGIEMRGAGAATKGRMSRGPMA
jgi:hypothetical protein